MLLSISSNMLWKFVPIFIFLQLIVADKPCISRKYNHDSIVCVCNSTYCDEISRVQPMKSGNYILYTSTTEGERFNKVYGKMVLDHGVPIKILSHTVLHVYKNITYQKIMGFGGAMTDSAAMNIMSLSPQTRNRLMNSYFSKDGLEYNMIRVPIGGTDFSNRDYKYNEYPEDDEKLSNFTLVEEDLKYKIPLLKRAQSIATSKLHLMASSWDAPKWMRKNHTTAFESHMKPEYYQTWADYHLRFLEEYDKLGLQFSSITTGNEAGTAILPREILSVTEFLGWTPNDQAEWIANNFGPTIRNSKFHDIMIISIDDQRYFTTIWLFFMRSIPNATDYMDGIALHWYANKQSLMAEVDIAHFFFPNKFIISNEASISGMVKGFWDTEIVHLGAWDKAENYVWDIIEDLNHWHVGWLDWNIALDMNGGPNHYKNYVDAAVIVNQDDDEFLKQPIFYAMGHFSKFIPRDSVRIQVSVSNSHIMNVAVLREDGGVTVVLYNSETTEKDVIVQDMNKGHIPLKLKPRSLNTLLYW